MSSLFDKLSKADNEKNNDAFKTPSPAANPGGGMLKIVVFISLILSMIALAGAVFLYQSLNAESRQRQALEATQVQFQEKAIALESTAEDYRSQIQSLSDELKQFSEEKKTMENELQKSKIEIAAFKNKINQIEEKTAAIKQATAVIKQAAEAVETVPKTAELAVKRSQVMTVNRKFNFVVINLGGKDNLKLGDPLNIQKNGEVTSRLKVEKLYDTFAAATILEESQDKPIQEGDLIERGS